MSDARDATPKKERTRTHPTPREGACPPPEAPGSIANTLLDRKLAIASKKTRAGAAVRNTQRNRKESDSKETNITALPFDLDGHVMSSIADRKPRWTRNEVHGERRKKTSAGGDHPGEPEMVPLEERLPTDSSNNVYDEESDPPSSVWRQLRDSGVLSGASTEVRSNRRAVVHKREENQEADSSDVALASRSFPPTQNSGVENTTCRRPAPSDEEQIDEYPPSYLEGGIHNPVEPSRVGAFAIGGDTTPSEDPRELQSVPREPSVPILTATLVEREEREAIYATATPVSWRTFIRDKRVQAVAALVVLVVCVAVGLSLGLEPPSREDPTTFPPTSDPTVPPRTERSYRKANAKIYQLVGEKMNDEESAAAQAADWILNQDLMQLEAESRNFIQRYVLVLLFFETQGMNWTECTPTDDPNNVDCEATCYDFYYGNPFDCDRKRWLTNLDECSWLGIGCNQHSAVQNIELIFNNLNGTLPPEITELKEVQLLSLIENWLTGTIPSKLRSMWSLTDLELNWNLFTGTFPELPESLSRLNLYHNMLSGTVPSYIGNLPALEGIHVGENALMGTIPTEIGFVANLKYAQWNDNLMTGAIPTEIGSLRFLDQLYLDNNLLSGTLPEEIGDCTLLEDFWIRNNNISGWIPDHFYDLTSLWRFYGQDNALSGTLSSNIGKLTSMEDFTIRDNFFSGTIPEEFTNLQNLTELWLHFNDFTGTTSDTFCDLLDVSLEEFRTDCAPTQPGDLAPYVTCPCCTHCCDHTSKCVNMTD